MTINWQKFPHKHARTNKFVTICKTNTINLLFLKNTIVILVINTK